MFDSLPDHFRSHGLSADIKTLLLVRKSFKRGLITTLGDLYLVLKGIVPTDPSQYGPFAVAFYDYFLDIEIKKGEKLEHAVARSASFKDWKSKKLGDDDRELDFNEITTLVDQFLDEVHLTSYDIQEILSGEAILKTDDPDRKDTAEQDDVSSDEDVTKAADYSKYSLQELKERMERVLEQQRRKHKGGDHWVGEEGRSPYGQRGAAIGGVRVGQQGGGKMARAVIGDRRFYPVDKKAKLSDDNIDVALTLLKGIEEESIEMRLDIPNTIKEGVKMGGLFLPIEREHKEKKTEVVLLIDNGGYSMTPYIEVVTRLFSKMKRRFTHDLQTYYFHNTIYGGAWSDERRTKYLKLDKILKLAKKKCVFVIGDADMGPYELSDSSMKDWQELKEHFRKMVWLNPTIERLWPMSDTIPIFRQIFPMFPLTPEGVEKAVQEMNKKFVKS
ncbi:MAG: hypothetical protein KJP00_05205 [Bacteroidia bacterium]|nr:hypothetical protein [Bacteroidia bacterium]